MALTVIAAYDVSEDARRARLAALLSAYGDRVQKSVFLLDVDAAELELIRARGQELIDTECDSLWLTPCCAACWAGRLTVGQVALPDKVLFWAVL